MDLDELAGILEGDPVYGGGRVDVATGEVWPTSAVDYAREIGQENEDESDDPDKWLWVHCEGSRDGYRDMEMFIGTAHDPGRADRLEIAISGRGAFRRFKDVLALARRTGSVACVFGRASAWAGPGLAGRRRLLRPQGAPSLMTRRAFRPAAHRRVAESGSRRSCTTRDLAGRKP